MTVWHLYDGTTQTREFQNTAVLLAYLAHHSDLVTGLTLKGDWKACPEAPFARIPHYGLTDEPPDDVA